MAKILVIGGFGYVGKPHLKSWQAEDMKVWISDKCIALSHGILGVILVNFVSRDLFAKTDFDYVTTCCEFGSQKRWIDFYEVYGRLMHWY